MSSNPVPQPIEGTAPGPIHIPPPIAKPIPATEPSEGDDEDIA